MHELPTLLPRHVSVTRPARRIICLPSFLRCLKHVRPVGSGTQQFLPKNGGDAPYPPWNI